MAKQAARLLSWLDRIERDLAGFAYLVCVGLILADVASRELFGVAIWGSQKIATYAAVVAGIFGLSLAVGTNAHFRIAVADHILPFAWVARASHILSALLFVVLAVSSCVFVYQAWSFQDRAPVLNVPLWPILTCFPIAFFTATLRHAIFAIEPSLRPGAST